MENKPGKRSLFDDDESDEDYSAQNEYKPSVVETPIDAPQEVSNAAAPEEPATVTTEKAETKEDQYIESGANQYGDEYSAP